MKQVANTAVAKQLKDQTRFLIDPRTSKLLNYWDLTTSIALIYTAMVTPAEVALLDAAKSVLEPLFIINRLLDIIFITDMVVQFRLMVEVTKTQSQGSVWVVEPRKIAQYYLHSWFTLDIVSVLVSGFDWVGLDFIATDESQSEALSNFKVLRVLRALRLAKLARLFRMSRVVKRWETRVAVNYALLSLIKSFFTIIFMGHWISCSE